MTDCFVHTFPGEEIQMFYNPPEEIDDLQLVNKAEVLNVKKHTRKIAQNIVYFGLNIKI